MATTSPLTKQVSRFNIDMDVSCVEECGWTGDMKNLTTHQDTCKHVEIDCELCDKEIKRKDMNAHLRDTCLENEVTCPKNCGGVYKRKSLEDHFKECGKLAQQVADLKTKQQTSIDGLNKQVQTLDKTVIDNQTRAMAAIETSQQQQQQKQNQLDQELHAQIQKCDRKHEDHEKREEGLQQSIARLEADLKQQQADQQAKNREQTSAHSRVENALKAQDDRTKQDIARIDKKQKQISDQQQKHETTVSEQQKTIAKIDAQLQTQHKASDTAKTDLQKQLSEVKKKQDEQQSKLAEQQSINSRQDTLIQEEQRAVAKLEEAIAVIERQQTSIKVQALHTKPTHEQNDSSKLSVLLKEHDKSILEKLAKLEKELADLEHQQTDQQGKLTDQQNSSKRLEAQLCEHEEVKFKKQEDVNSRLEKLLQELKTEQNKQHTMIMEQQATIRELERQTQEQKDTIERLSHTHWRGGTERAELFIEKVERVIRREVTSERITWCWAGILIALPSIAIATYENL